MSRLIVVSNRVTIPNTKDDASAGGLAVAIHAALQRYRGIWFGWSGQVVEKHSGQVNLAKAGAATIATIDLSESDFDEYYNGYANRTLWPLFHYRTDLTSYDRRFDEGYDRVNENFANALAPLVEEDDLVWVHDYHLIPLAAKLRALDLNHRMGFFLHIPFPTPEILLTMSTHRTMVAALFAYDLVGFQTESDLRSFQDYVLHEEGGVLEADGRLTAFGRTISVATFPIGLDTPQFMKMTESVEAKRFYNRMAASLNDRHLVIGVDRLDYTKGLPERLLAYENLLEKYADAAASVLMLQIAPPSRLGVPEYEDIRHELEQITGRINGRFADFDRVPIRYVNRGYSRRALAGLYRASRVGVVTPLRDGMNLVAKEFVAAQQEDDPGILVLSRFAGASRQFKEALVVNPFNHEEVADAIRHAVEMPLRERRRRWSGMMESVVHEDVFAWRDNYVNALSAAPAYTKP